MTDLHSHVLQQMDDGASNIQESICLLNQYQEQNIQNISLTSHYDCEIESVENFLKRRNESYVELKNISDQIDGFCLKLGAEIKFSPDLLKKDLKALCLEGTNVLLIELPTYHRPQFLEEVLNEIRNQNFIIVIAHIERYSYIIENPPMLLRWNNNGIYTQINASTVLRRSKNFSLIHKLIKWGYVQVVASDTHSVVHRPVRLKDAFELIEKYDGKICAARLQENADQLFWGNPIFVSHSHYPKKILGRWI